MLNLKKIAAQALPTSHLGVRYEEALDKRCRVKALSVRF
jgi:hypothetical protein